MPLSLFAANERVFDARAEPTRDLRHQRPAPQGLGPHPLGAPAPGTPTRPPADGAEIPSCRPGSAPAAPPSLPSLLGCLSPRRLPPSSRPVVLGLGPKPRCHLWKTTLLSTNIWSPPRILRPSATAPGRGWATRSGQRSISSRRAVRRSAQDTEESPCRALVPHATQTHGSRQGPRGAPGLQRKVSAARGRGRHATGPRCRT